MLSEKEQRVLKETRLRNLKRTFSKMKEHAELTTEARNLQTEIAYLEEELGL